MSNLKLGDRVRVRERPDWPSPPGYPLAGLSGSITELRQDDGFIMVRLDKSTAAPDAGSTLTLRVEAVEPAVEPTA